MTSLLLTGWRRMLWLPLPLVVTLVALPVLADTLDSDGDGVLDPFDNCVYALNANQEDLAGVGVSEADGIGAACQCGDLDDDGDVDVLDAALLERHLATSDPDPPKCNVVDSGGPDADTDGCVAADLAALRQALANQIPFTNVCRAAVGKAAGAAGPTLVAYAGDDEIILDWEAVASSLVTGYDVLRASTSGGPYAVIATDVTTTSYIDTDVTNDTPEFYLVRAQASEGASNDSNEATATPSASTGPTDVFNDVTPTPEDPTVWTLRGSPYIIKTDPFFNPDGQIVIKEGATLLIEPGVVVEMPGEGKLIVGPTGETGRLIASGVKDKEITFTSDSATECAAGEWFGLELLEGTLAGTVLDHVDIECAGRVDSPAISVELGTETVRLSNGTISKVGNNGIWVDQTPAVVHGWDIVNSNAAKWAMSVRGIPMVRGSNLNLTGALQIACGMLAPCSGDARFANLQFLDYQNPGLKPAQLPARFVGEVMNATTLDPVDENNVVVVLGGPLPESATWPAHRYEVTSAPITIWSNNARTLTLEAGAELLFDALSGLQVGTGNYQTANPPPLFPGGLIARGSEAEKVRLGPLTPGTPWRGVIFDAKTLPQSRLEHVELEEGNVQMETGYPGNGACLAIRDAPSAVELVEVDVSGCPGAAIVIDQSSVQLRGGSVAGTGDDGIVCSGASASPRIAGWTLTGGGSNDGYEGDCAATIEQNTITGWDAGIRISEVQPTLVVRNNDIQGNTSAALVNEDSTTLDARINFWGGVDPSTVITGSALTNPWLAAAPATETYALRTASSVPEVFSSVAGRTKFRASAPAVTEWTLDLTGPGGFQYRTLGIAPSFAWDWGGNAADGTYDYTLLAEEYQGPGEVTLAGTVVVDGTLPSARVDQPGELELTAGGELSVYGKTSGTSYRVEYGVGAAPASFTEIDSDTGQADDFITLWDTQSLAEGLYTLRLVSSNGMSEAADRVAVRVLVIDPVTTTASLFAPNNNGLYDWVGVQSATSIETDWLIEFLDSGGQPVHQIGGEGTEVYAVWEGEAGLGRAADGSYSVRLTATDPRSGDPFSSAGGSIEIDTTPPTLDITSPAVGTPLVNMLSGEAVVGTVDDLRLESYELGYGLGTPPLVTATEIGSGAIPVVNSTLGSLPAEGLYSPIYANGDLTLQLYGIDTLGNTDTLWHTVPLDRLEISNVSTSSVTFNPYLGEDVQISYAVSHDADVDVEIFRALSQGASSIVLLEDTVLAGSNSVTWDGTDGMGSIAGEGAYYFSISASATQNRQGGFNDPTAPLQGPSGTIPGLSFNDKSLMDMTISANVDPYKNDEIRISYTLPLPLPVWIHPRRDPYTPGEEVKLLDGKPTAAGPNELYWDLRWEDGEFHNWTYGVWYRPGMVTVENPIVPLEVNPILVVGQPLRVEHFRALPYLFHPHLSEATRIYYGVSTDADVSIEILDPSGTHVKDILVDADHSAGEGPELYWDGTNDTGQLTDLSGSFTVKVTAEEKIGGQLTGRTTERRGTVFVQQ